MINKLRNKFSNMHIYSQIFSIILIVCAVSTIIFCMMYCYTENQYNAQLEEKTTEKLNMVAGNIDKELSEIIGYTVSISFKESIIDVLKSISYGKKTLEKKFEEYLSLKNECENYVNFKNYISYTNFYDYQGRYLVGKRKLAGSVESAENISDFIKSGESSRKIVCEDGNLIIMQTITDIYTAELYTVGIVTVGINLNKLISELKLIRNLNYELLIQSNGKSVYVSTNEMNNWNMEEQWAIIGENKYCVVRSDSDILNIKYILFNNYNDDTNRLKNIKYFIVMCAVLQILVFLIMIIVFIQCLIVPIKVMHKSIIESDTLEAPPEKLLNSDTKNELYEFYLHSYQSMRRINELQKMNYDKELEINKTELEMLYSQINPHFLYNTLDTIYWIAISDGNEMVAQMSHSLAQLFRIATKNDELWVTMDKELSILKLYTNIQKIRFIDRMEINIQLQEDLSMAYVPKMILQPIVENTIKHIVEEQRKKCVINVNVYSSEENIIIDIKDNGPQLIDKYNNILLNGGGYGVGISNIQRRLKVAYNDKQKMEFILSEDNCFVVRITIPKKFEL